MADPREVIANSLESLTTHFAVVRGDAEKDADAIIVALEREGLAIVLVEPTEDMLIAVSKSGTRQLLAKALWQAMLRAHSGDADG